MRILLVHNFYQQPGGEDSVFRNEASLLREHGNEVREYTEHNDRIATLGRLRLASETIWSEHSRGKLEALLREYQPEIVHFHNTFPLISPSAYSACRSVGIPVVQTLHNYRLLCPGANLFRRGEVCEDCIGKSLPWPAIVHGCYRNSRVATSVVATMLSVHRQKGTWRDLVDIYIALSEFSRNKFVDGGLPRHKVLVKENFLLHDPGVSTDKGVHAIYVGRLSPEKGVRALPAAWELLQGNAPLQVFGDGPLKAELQNRAKSAGLDQISFAGQVPHETVIQSLKRSSFAILPSGCYENSPLSVIEAFACGIPALVAGTGALGEIVQDGATGLHFDPADPQDIASKVKWAFSHPNEMEVMGKQARRIYEQRYTPAANYRRTIEIYQQAIGSYARFS